MSSLLNKLGMLQNGLDVTWKRNEVISNNIANADTPNFKASKVEFDSILKSQMSNSSEFSMRTSNSKHMNIASDSMEPLVTQDNSTSMRLDGNNVDIENEMTELAKNNLLYNALVQKTSKEISRIKYAISEGKR